MQKHTSRFRLPTAGQSEVDQLGYQRGQYHQCQRHDENKGLRLPAPERPPDCRLPAFLAMTHLRNLRPD